METSERKALAYPLTEEEQITLTTYETIAENWDARYAHPRYKDHDWYVFIDQLPKGAAILDLGCGTAIQTAAWVVSEGFRYTGIDISENMLAQARKNLAKLITVTPESIQNMDMRQLGFADETFDGFICLTSFMHLPRKTLPTALAEARRVLKSHGKGLISISQGDFEGLWSPPEVSLQAFATCWKREELCTLFKEIGFSICFEQDLGDMLGYVLQKI